MRILLFFALGGVFIWQSSFMVQENEQVLVLSFGKISQRPIKQAGAYMKWPWESIKRFDKRMLSWDSQRGEIPTCDQKLVWVDTTARWRIEDPVLFYKTVGHIKRAKIRMGTILEGVTKDTISSYPLIESVRNSNKILADLRKKWGEEGLTPLATEAQEVKVGREKLSEMMAQRAESQLLSMGVKLVDVQIRSIAYKEVVEKKVYERMISESQTTASKIRAMGKGEEARILGQMELNLKKIRSEAYRKSQEILGKAQKEAIGRLAAVAEEDPQYYAWLKKTENYGRFLKASKDLTLSSQNPFLGPSDL